MVKTKGLERTTDKWIRRARVARPDYESGIKAPKVAWSTAAAAAKDVYREAITSPQVPELFAAGIRRAGDAKWSKMALEKGAERYARGVELGEDYYKSVMTDVLGTIERTTLPERGPAGSEKNYERVKKLGMALRAWKLARKATPSS